MKIKYIIFCGFSAIAMGLSAPAFAQSTTITPPTGTTSSEDVTFKAVPLSSDVTSPETMSKEDVPTYMDGTIDGVEPSFKDTLLSEEREDAIENLDNDEVLINTTGQVIELDGNARVITDDSSVIITK